MAQQAEFQKTILKQMSKISAKKRKKKRSRQRYSDSDSSDSDWPVGSNCNNKPNICSSKDSENNSSKLKRKKVNNTNIVPINAIQTNSHELETRYQDTRYEIEREPRYENTRYDRPIKRIHSTSRRQVVKGRGYATATPAIPQLRETESPKQKKVWKMLFDSGSDGDIAFIKKSKKHSLKCRIDFIFKGGRPVMVSSKLIR